MWAAGVFRAAAAQATHELLAQPATWLAPEARAALGVVGDKVLAQIQARVAFAARTVEGVARARLEHGAQQPPPARVLTVDLRVLSVAAALPVMGGSSSSDGVGAVASGGGSAVACSGSGAGVGVLEAEVAVADTTLHATAAAAMAEAMAIGEVQLPLAGAVQRSAGGAPVAAVAVEKGPRRISQQLEELLGEAVARGTALGEGLRVPDHDGVPLHSYAHPDVEVSEVLAHARTLLPKHMQEVRVDLAGWSASQVARFCILLYHTATTVFSTDKWDVGFCETLCHTAIGPTATHLP
jgi:hypothetical protein